MQWGKGSSSDPPPVNSLQTSGRDGVRRDAPMDARDMMMRGDESAASGSIFSRLNIGAELEKVKNTMQAGVGKAVQTLGIKKKDEDSSQAGSSSMYEAPSFGDFPSNFRSLAGFGSSDASSRTAAGKLALPSGGGGCTVEGGAPGGSSQLRCYSCTSVMSHPQGAVKVTCPKCGSVNATAAPGATPKPSNISVSCSGCHQPTICPVTTKRLECQHCNIANVIITCQSPKCSAIVSCSEGTAAVACPACKHVNRLDGQPGPHVDLHVTCVQCQTRLMMPGNAPAVRCPRCSQITNRSDPRARAEPATSVAAATAGDSNAGDRRGVSWAPDLRQTADDHALEEAIRRSLGEPARTALPASGMMQHQRGEPREASHEGEPDENALLMMLTNFADITGCDLPVAQEYLQANGWRMEVAINNFLNRGSGATVDPIVAVAAPQAQVPADAVMFDFSVPSPAQPAAVEAQAVSVDGDSSPQQGYAPETVQPVRETIEWRGVEDWLVGMGLEKYVDILKTQELTDPEALRDVTDEDLKEMSVGTIGARRKILAAIRRLNEADVVICEVPAGGTPADGQAGELSLRAPSLGDIRVPVIEADGVIAAEGTMEADDAFGKPIQANGELSADEMFAKPIEAEGIHSDGDIAAGEMVSEPIVSGLEAEVPAIASDGACKVGDMAAEVGAGVPAMSSEEIRAPEGVLESS